MCVFFFCPRKNTNVQRRTTNVKMSGAAHNNRARRQLHMRRHSGGLSDYERVYMRDVCTRSMFRVVSLLFRSLRPYGCVSKSIGHTVHTSVDSIQYNVYEKLRSSTEYQVVVRSRIMYVRVCCMYNIPPHSIVVGHTRSNVTG